MVRFFYNISIHLLNTLLALAAIFDPRARKLYRGRKGWYSKLKKAVEMNGEGMIWFHCASLGEFEQGRPVIEKLKELRPASRILLTFYSPSGYEIRKNYEPADAVIYLPSDTRSNARRFITTARPSLAIFVKYEFWYNFIESCRSRNIPLLSISSIFRTDQVFFKPWGEFFRNMLKDFSAFFVQDEASGELLKTIGISNVTVSGDTRFDRVNDICSHPKEIELASQFSNGSDIMVMGSTWPSDMKLLSEFINESDPSLKFMIAPHNIHESKLLELERSLTVSTVRFSASDLSGDPRVLIIDNVGMLYSLYRYARIAYVGGAFKGGLHNILEPAAYSIPVIFGNHPSNKKFRETDGLASAGGGFAVSNLEELKTLVLRLMKEKEAYEKAAMSAGNYIRMNTGATGKIVDHILSLIKK